MKKFFFSLLAIAAIASCAKTEAVYMEENAEILLSPVAALQTKAEVNNAIDGTTYPAAEHFTVIGYWADQPAGSTFASGTTYLSAVDFAKKNDFWAGADKSYYWPKNGSLRFACFSPTVINGGALAHDLATDTWTATGYTQSASTASTIDFMVAQTPASYTAATAAENVSVVFEHALSWITLQVKAADAEAAKAFTINKVTINDVKTVADMTAKYPAKVWSNWSVPADYEVFTGAKYSSTEPMPVDKAAIIETVERGTVIIPQATTTVTIDYTQNAMEGTPALENQSITVSLALDAALTPWVAGKHYVYTLIFSLDEILINPSVAKWEDVIVNDTPADVTEVATAAELVAAAAKGGDIVLTADINLTASVEITQDVNLELNGKAIKAASTDAIVVANGANLTVNGDGKVWAATDENSSANAIWVMYGNVTLNGGNYYVGKDGSSRNDCIYVGAASQKDNADQYVSTLVINGGTYEAAAQEMGQYWVLNVQDQHYAAGSTITVNGGQFKNFDPSNNISEGANTTFVATGKTVEKSGEYYIVK